MQLFKIPVLKSVSIIYIGYDMVDGSCRIFRYSRGFVYGW